MNRLLLFLSLTLWGISLVLPGIVYEPTLTDNPKYGFCAQASKKDVLCSREKNGSYTCWRPELGNLPPTDKILETPEEIAAYCGQNWRDSQFAAPKIHRGYEILAIGWLGIFIANFAWYGNILWLIALVNGLLRRYKGSLYASIIGFGLGLTAFALREVPKDESGGRGYMIDYLGVGYYVWLLALALPGILAYRELKGDSRYHLSLKTIVIILFSTTAPLIAPTIILNQFNERQHTDSETQKAERQQQYDDNFITQFETALEQKNYKVTLRDNGKVFYLQNGTLVRAGGAPEKDTEDYLIYNLRRAEVYTVHPITKTYSQASILGLGGEKSPPLERMRAISGIGLLREFNSQIDVSWWERVGTTQKIDHDGVKIELSIDPTTKLPLSLRIGTEKSPTGVWHFQFEEISGEAMIAAKTFPFDYQKIEE